MQKNQSPYRLIYTHEKWQEIKKTLIELTKGNTTLSKLIEILKGFHSMTNPFHSNYYKFKVLQDVKVTHCINVLRLMQLIAGYILNQQFVNHKIPIVQPNITKKYQLNKATIILMMCLMAMCLIIRSSFTHEDQSTNFIVFFHQQKSKAQSVISYLDQVLSKQFDPEEKFLIVRNSSKEIIDPFFLYNCKQKLGQFELLQNGVSVEDFNGFVKIDFANQYLGGGALDYGNVQEEIMFLCHPELYTIMLLCPRMEKHEAIGLVGFRKLFKITGYGSTTEFAGPEQSKYDFDESGRYYKEYIVAIDATYKHREQFEEQFIKREMIKADAGFTCFDDIKTIVSGNWGCGAFGGDIYAKLIIQWITATLAHKKLLYCPFNKKKLLEPIYQAIKNLTVQQAFDILWSYRQELKKYGQQKKKNYSFEDHIKKKVHQIKESHM